MLLAAQGPAVAPLWLAPKAQSAEKTPSGGAPGPEAEAKNAGAPTQAPPPPAPNATPPPSTDGAAPTVGRKSPHVQKLLADLEVDETPPFPSEELALSEVLERAAKANPDLVMGRLDVEISEARVLAALGAYDVILTAGFTASLQEQPQRGSQFTVSRGSRTLSGFVGFSRKLETGGNISLRIDASRNQTDQPLNFFSPTSPSVTINSYRLAPTLTLTHPLLKGAGIRVNRADIDRARIATSTAEAARQLAAENTARDVISAYWDVLFAQRNLVNKRLSLETARRQLERTRIQVAAGRLAPVDAKAVEQQVAAKESEALVAEQTLLDASLTLRTLMGQDFSTKAPYGVVPSTDPVVEPIRVDVDAEIRKALENNAQVRQLELAIASRRIDELVAANQRLPQLDFQATFTPQGRSVDTLPDSSTGDPGSRGNWAEAFRNFFNDDVRNDGVLADWMISGSLNLTWDIQNRVAKGNHEAALGELRKARENLKKIRQTIATSVIRAAYNVRTAAERMRSSDISLELALQNLETEQARFEVGRSTNYDVMQRLDEADAAAAAALQAQIDYLKALVQLKALTGEILPAFGLDPAGRVP
ncbi:MAG: TolC family protein [Deltaproteobacteria bacterium]|nr:MAG: TolC family protein [Deltaproteobacteria bacterium]